VIGFSLGGRGVIEAFKSLDPSMLRKVNNVVFFAADEDQSILDKEYVRIVRKFPNIKTTVYASSNDFAMEVSSFGFVNGGTPIGSTRGISAESEIVTIDYTDVNPLSLLCFFSVSPWIVAQCRGHAALFESREIANDLYYLLVYDWRPERRHGIQEVTAPGGQTYFRMMKWKYYPR
jgi:esterase/lipase superfamily enzyme